MRRIIKVSLIAGLMMVLFCGGVRIYELNRELAYVNRDLELMKIDLAKTADEITKYTAEQTIITSVLRGLASWYGPGFHGRQMANGEIYDQFSYTVAHKTLPLGTWVVIKNESNGREAVGIVNDRGPYIKDREFDFSYALAQRLDFEKRGLTQVTVQILGVLK